MIIGLTSAKIKDNDTSHNLQQMEHYIIEASKEGIDLLCFGESFIHGFDGLTWDYNEDLKRALIQNDEKICYLQSLALNYGIGISFGYIEKDNNIIYSSNLVIDNTGNIIDNFKRVSIGWKEPIAPNEYYKEGKGFHTFSYKGKIFTTAICGDLWHDTFLLEAINQPADCLLWPLYVDFAVDDWNSKLFSEYEERVSNFKFPVLMINSYSDKENHAKGGCFVFQDGTTVKQLPMGELGILKFTL